MELFFQMLHSFTHTSHSRFKFLFVNQSISIAIDQTGDASSELAHLAFQTLMLIRLLLGFQTPSIILLQPFWFFKQSADAPFRLLHPSGPCAVLCSNTSAGRHDEEGSSI